MTTKKPIRNPVLPKHVAKFDQLIRLWQERLGLRDWRIERSAIPSKFMAEIKTRDLTSRLAVYRIGTSFGAMPVTPHAIESTVVHELLHVLLHELVELAKGETNEDTLMSAEHRVVNVLEKLLCPKDPQ